MNPIRKRLLSPTSGLLLACGLSAMASAQTAATDTPTTDEDVVVLNPFEVNSTRDVGYLAQNTLAGSRLNTELKNTAAAISVLTPEFLKDIGATSMKDIILFQNNAVPDVGDSDNSVNGNPLIGHDEWQLRIRGVAASYARNFFAWENSTDLYNIERVDQSRGPNSILFGFGSPGGIVNSSTKQASVDSASNAVGVSLGSWSTYRGTLDSNQVLIPGKLAIRLNAMLEDGDSWRKWEFNNARRAHLALKYHPSKDSSLRVEGEVGRVKDNVARPWLAIDQSFIWRQQGRPLSNSSWVDSWSNPGVVSFWPDHYVVNDADGSIHNWLGMSYGSNGNDGNLGGAWQSIDTSGTSWADPTWSAWSMTEAGLAVIPQDSNLAGPDATRKTTYHTISAFYDKQVNERLSFELALNHQSNHFTGYDADGSRATTYYGSSSEIWGDASQYLPDWTANPHAGQLYLENNWTRREQEISSTQLRASLAYSFDIGSVKNRFAALYEHMWRDYSRLEECQVFLGAPYSSSAVYADQNRVYLRHYFTEGDSSDLHVASWKTPVANSGWVADQPPEDTNQSQDTFMAALQSGFFEERFVTTIGVRADRMGLDYNPGSGAASPYEYVLDPAHEQSETFEATTLTLGAVFHATRNISLYGNHSNSRSIPNLGIHLVDSYLAPMPKSDGTDAGLKFDFFDGKLYATVGYYTTNAKDMTDWANVQTAVTDRNTKILTALHGAGLITADEREARTINANGYRFDRKAKGWEFTLVANPTNNWRISANFSVNDVKAENSMADVKAWAEANSAWWLEKAAAQGGSGFLLGGGDWDTLGANIGWMNGSIDPIVALDGYAAKGERKYGANLYTKYTFGGGVLKGFSIGGGGRYQSANVLGMYDDTLDGEYNPTVHYGRELVLFDASLGYSFPTRFLGEGSWVDLQLNISNVFNKRDYQIYTLAWWGVTNSDATQLTRVPERIGLQEPREVTFTATLHF